MRRYFFFISLMICLSSGAQEVNLSVAYCSSPLRTNEIYDNIGQIFIGNFEINSELSLVEGYSYFYYDTTLPTVILNGSPSPNTNCW